MTPRRAADRGPQPRWRGRNPSGRLRLQHPRRASARVRRSVASSPPVTASLRLPAICWSTAPERLLPSRSSVPPWGPRTAAARHTARRGRGRRRCSAPRCLASTLGLPVTSACTIFRPSRLAASAAHHPATSPQVRSTRTLPSNCKIRWASSGGTRSSMSFRSSFEHSSARKAAVRSPCLVDPQRQTPPIDRAWLGTSPSPRPSTR
jgi:hypothetical protein